MSAFKGTPGPWKECGHERGGCICGLVFAESSDLVIADASPHCDEETRGHRPDEAARKANARLIAAAPDGLIAGADLLDVVNAAIRAGDWKVDGACDPDAAIRRMEQFIAKATGEQP